MILTPYEKREFAAATYLYWEAKAESVDIGRIKFAKKTKRMDLDDPNSTESVASKISTLRSLASNERAQNLLFTEKERVVGPWNLVYRRGMFYMEFVSGDEWYRPLALFGSAISYFPRSRDDFLFVGTMYAPVYDNNTLMTREDLQSFIRKGNNSAMLVGRVNAIKGILPGRGIYDASRLRIPNLVEANYSLEAVQTSEMNFTDWAGSILFSVPGKTLALPTGARDLSQIVPRRI